MLARQCYDAANIVLAMCQRSSSMIQTCSNLFKHSMPPWVSLQEHNVCNRRLRICSSRPNVVYGMCLVAEIKSGLSVFLQERMLRHFFNRNPLINVTVEHLSYQIYAIFRERKVRHPQWMVKDLIWLMLAWKCTLVPHVLALTYVVEGILLVHDRV